MLEVFHLNHPKYDTDETRAVANPVRALQDIWLPGIICPISGTWAGSRRTYYPITNRDLRKQLEHSKPTPVDEWFKLAEQVRAEVGSDPSLTLWPGDVLGTPRVLLKAVSFSDFLYPFPGQLIVRPAVVDVLIKSKLTGFKAVQIEVHWAEELPQTALLDSTPELYELMVTGRAWVDSFEKFEKSRCPICRRPDRSSGDKTKINASNWDGSDFFQLDENPNRVLVTAKVCEILADAGFTNYACIPFGIISD